MHAPLPLWAEKLAVFDTETTGIDTVTARIVSCTIALLGSRGEVLERYDWLVNPGVEIPEAAASVHGITTEIAQQSGVDAAVGVAQIVQMLLDMLDRGFAVVAYNASYDLTLLRAEALRHNIEWPTVFSPVVDPMILDKQFDRFRKGKRTLDAVTTHYGVPLELAHDAGEDAIAAGRLAQVLARKYAGELPDQLDALHLAQIDWAAAQAERFQQYMRSKRDPSYVIDGGWPFKAAKKSTT